MEKKPHELEYQLIMEAVPFALLLADNKGKIIYLNNFTSRLFSINSDELSGKNILELIPDMKSIKPPEFWEQYFQQPITLRLEEKHEIEATSNSGRTFPVEIKMRAIYIDGESFTLATITDISNRVKAHEDIRLIVESALNAMILTDSRGRISMVNKQTEVLFGYSRNELAGKKIEILVPQRMKHQHPSHRNKFYEHPKARPMGAGRDLYGVKKDGTEIPVEIGLNPIEKDGELLVLASVIDITERKKNEEAIKLYTRKIEEKNKELEEFAHVASHDLREPLNSIISLTELLVLKKSNQFDDETRTMLDYISKSSVRMSEMIIDLLEYARLGNEKKLALTDLNELVKLVLIDCDASIKSSNASVVLNSLPVMHVYPAEARSLFQNLVSNALKYRKPDVKPEITISSRQVGKGWIFTVSDNGIGIPENQKEKIFNLFHRLHGRNKYEGTGIGLAQCRKITELHHGKIWIESVPDKGSTFYIFIPSNLGNKIY